MPPDPRRNFLLVTIFWLFLALCVGVLGVGWTMNHAGLDDVARAYLSDLHISLGLSAAVLFALQLLLGAAVALFGGPFHPRDGRQTMAFSLRLLISAAFVAVAGAGALTLAYRGEQIFFWRFALPPWDAGDRQLAEKLETVHGLAAHALAAAILAYVAFTAFDHFSPAAPRGRPAPPVSAPTSIASMIADGLSQSFRFFGGAAFWLQLFLGVVSGLLLVFGFVGHTVSPNVSGFGDAIYWASTAIGLLAFTTIFAFFYSKAAPRIRSHPERYLSYRHRLAFWYVGLGGFLNIVGVLISFGGVGLSVALLIGKTVSQPPGIAITDPVKIIRALDVFILLVNFSLLFAHFIGFGVAAWLNISALKARHQYVVATEADDK